MLVLEQVEEFWVRYRDSFSKSGLGQMRNSFFSSDNNGRRAIKLKDCSARRAWLEIIAPCSPKKMPNRLKTHRFLILKTSQMFAHDLISSAAGLPKICIGHECVQSLFLDGRETGGCPSAFRTGGCSEYQVPRPICGLKSCSQL
jgi:hypothetical protein